MDNYAIADQLSLLSKLMDIHGENAFKSKSYSSAAFTIEKLPQPIAGLPHEKIFAIRGIGESVGKKIVELLQNGELLALQQLIAQTPEGVLEMMNVKGLGPKKIHTLWKELHISDLESLKEACLQNKIAAKKGFGEKTQQNILEAIHFLQQNTGVYRFAQVESFAEALQQKLELQVPGHQFSLTGEFRRQLEVVQKLEWVTTASKSDLRRFFDEEQFAITAEGDDFLELVANDALALTFYLSEKTEFARRLFVTSSSPEFALALEQLPHWSTAKAFASEEEICDYLQLQYISPYLREKEQILKLAQQHQLPTVVQTSDIKGLIHAHSNWSDGAHTIEEMALELINLGYEYMVISDHSKAAYYANGLNEQRIREQHIYIDSLNEKLAPFKIYKSIECDILSDGSLDYADKILATFDLVIASIHSNLQMPEEKAMMRLLGAINNKYVTILGHMTGRLLAKRKGYPVDHKSIIDACAANHVVIEINANPARLDMDWRWIDYALEKGVMLSINPDAHSFDDMHLIKYGVLVAQKGGLTPAQNLSSMSQKEFETFLEKRRQLKRIG
ncbi:MAG: DNA polymerase/3'-5' exonuclease PolX [Chitinophagaceae bacterium]